jgi:hypothetical protein
MLLYKIKRKSALNPGCQMHWMRVAMVQYLNKIRSNVQWTSSPTTDLHRDLHRGRAKLSTGISSRRYSWSRIRSPRWGVIILAATRSLIFPAMLGHRRRSPLFVHAITDWTALWSRLNVAQLREPSRMWPELSHRRSPWLGYLRRGVIHTLLFPHCTSLQRGEHALVMLSAAADL